MNDNAIALCQYINQYYWIKMNDNARALTNENNVTCAKDINLSSQESKGYNNQHAQQPITRKHDCG